jgi:hypothetical protein
MNDYPETIPVDPKLWSDIDFEDEQRGMELRNPHQWEHVWASLGLVVAIVGAVLWHIGARL